MQESQRTAILNAFGVKPLYPRFALTGSKASLKLSEEISDSSSQDQTLLSQTVPTSDAIQSQAIASMVDAPVTSSHSTDAPESTQLEAPIKKDIKAEISLLANIKADLEDKKSVKPLKLRYRVFQLGFMQMLVEQPNVEFSHSRVCQKFFSQLYYFLTDQKDFKFSESQFDWPPSKQFPMADSKETAAQACKSFLKEKSVDEVKWLVIWGNSFEPFFSEEKLAVGEVLTDEIHMLQLDSIESYFNVPENKKLLWQHLQAIKKSLA